MSNRIVRRVDRMPPRDGRQEVESDSVLTPRFLRRDPVEVTPLTLRSEGRCRVRKPVPVLDRPRNDPERRRQSDPVNDRAHESGRFLDDRILLRRRRTNSDQSC